MPEPRWALREAGLNYDELQALGDPVAIGIKIVEAAFEAQADSTIADAEERDIAAEYAAQATLSPAGATEQEMSQAIENGIRDIGKIFGVTS